MLRKLVADAVSAARAAEVGAKGAAAPLTPKSGSGGDDSGRKDAGGGSSSPTTRGSHKPRRAGGGCGDDDDDDDDGDGNRRGGGGTGRSGGESDGGEDDEGGSEYADAAGRFAALFGGHPLPCPHDAEGNPFPRPPSLRARTVHYSPEAVGDFLGADFYRRLGEGQKRELCTLIPLCSYLHDLCVAFADLSDALRDGARPPSRAACLAALDPLAVHAESLLSFAKERVDELEVLSKDRLRAAGFDPLYGNERSLSGARSALGEALHSSHVAKRHSRISGAAASADVRALAGRTTSSSATRRTPRASASDALREPRDGQRPRGRGDGSGGGGGGGGGGSSGGGARAGEREGSAGSDSRGGGSKGRGQGRGRNDGRNGDGRGAG